MFFSIIFTKKVFFDCEKQFKNPRLKKKFFHIFANRLLKKSILMNFVKFYTYQINVNEKNWL